MNFPVIQILPCDIALEGHPSEDSDPRTRWPERLIHYGGRRGLLGVTAGPLLLLFNLGLGLLWSYLGIFWVSVALSLWIVVSAILLEGRCLWDHCMVFVTTGILGHSAGAVEAWTNKGMSRTLPRSVPENFELWRPRNLTAGQKAAVIVRLESRIGIPYSKKAIVMFGLDYIVGLGLWDVFLFRKHFLTDEDLVCSTYAAVGFWEAMNHVAGYNFGVKHWRMIAPDTISDFCHAHPQFYSLVAERKHGVWKTVPLQGVA